MNTTLTTDTDDDPDANSRRLLTNKVNSSQTSVPTAKRKQQITHSTFYPENSNANNNNNSNISTFTSGSILSKSSLNMTNVTPLNGSLVTIGNNANTNATSNQMAKPVTR